jgi:hypothetical protein
MSFATTPPDAPDQAAETAPENAQDAPQADAPAGDWWDKDYDGPPPWELARENAESEHLLERDPETGQPARRPKPYRGPGAVTHRHPMLSYGAAGDEVVALCDLLAELGYDDNAVARGQSPGNVLDNTVMADVSRFCSDYGVRNDVDEFQGQEVPANRLVDHHVGPYIWQALEAAAEAQRDAS